MTNHAKQRTAWIAGALLGLAMGCLAGCSNGPKAQGEEHAAKTEEAVAEVTVTRVTRETITATLAVSGNIAALPNRDVKVSSLVPGRIAEMLVTEGDSVRQGQPLARIEDRPLRDQIQQAEAAVAQARASLENARLSLQRNENLFQRGIAAGKELEDARTQVRVTEAALRQGEAALATARLQLSRAEIRSPLDGTVVKRFLSAGEQVDGSPAQALVEVANLGEVELFASVPAAYLHDVHPGQKLPISSDAFPGTTLTGRIVAISPAVDPATNVGLVRIRIVNQARLLRLGMFLSVRVPLITHPDALVVPPQAIYRDEKGQPRIYRVRGDTAEAVPVEPGIESQGRVELLSGAQAGETVVLSGAYGLPDHSRIKIKP